MTPTMHGDHAEEERMTRNARERSMLLTATLVAAAAITAAGARAQSVRIGGDRLEVLDTDGDSAVLIDDGADYTAGGNGLTASLNLRSADGPTTLFYHAFQAQLIIGGGNHEGILSVKDDDGVTTTIDLDGRIGRLLLGALGEDGDLIVNDGNAVERIRLNGANGNLVLSDDTGAVTLRLDSANGNVTNAAGGEGLVKAWARIEADGDVASCWRCASASHPLAGRYTVEFDVAVGSRPLAATIDGHGVELLPQGVISVSQFGGNTVQVNIADVAGAASNQPFTLIVY